MRLAQVITGLELGGGGAVVRTIAAALDWSRFDMDLYCIHEGGVLEGELRSLGCNVTVIEGAWDYHRRIAPYSVSKTLHLSNLLRQGKYDVVHTHLFPADVIGRIAAKLAGVPVILGSLHNMGHWKTRRHVALNRLLERFTDKVICCSHYQQEVVAGEEPFIAPKLLTIHHGARLARFDRPFDRQSLVQSLGLRPDRLTVGTVGRTIPEKGHGWLIDAIPAVLRNQPEAQFLIVGEGSERGRLEARAEALGCRDRICFAGARADVPEMLALMDVFVFPSLSEGFGIAVIEAMASRLPVVCSRIRPLDEIVVEGTTGRLVEPHQSDALATRLCELLESSERRRAFGDAGRARVEQQFTDGHMVRAHQDLYLELYRASTVRRGEKADPLLCH